MNKMYIEFFIRNDIHGLFTKLYTYVYSPWLYVAGRELSLTIKCVAVIWLGSVLRDVFLVYLLNCKLQKILRKFISQMSVTT